MPFRFTLTLSLLAGGLLAGPTYAQDVSPAELDRLAAQRQEAIGPRDWGPPVAATPDPQLMPLGGHVTCMSPRMEFEPVYAGPGSDTKQVGVAPPQLAVTTTTSGGWTRILRLMERPPGYRPRTCSPGHPRQPLRAHTA